MVMRESGPFFLKNRLYTIVTVLAFLLLFNSCGEMTGPQTQTSGAGSLAPDGEFSTPFPKQLEKHRSGLTAEVQVVKGDGTFDRTFTLNIDPDAHRVSGRVDGLSLGDYTFTIRFRINGILVATQSTSGAVTGNATTSIAFNALQFPDDDNDGFTNLAEVQFGTDHLLAGSKPPPELFRFSTSYAMSDVVGSAPIAGASTVGTSSSASYIMTSG